MEIEDRTISQLRKAALFDVVDMLSLWLLNFICFIWWLYSMSNGEWLKSLAIVVPVCLYNCIKLLARINRKIRHADATKM